MRERGVTFILHHTTLKSTHFPSYTGRAAVSYEHSSMFMPNYIIFTESNVKIASESNFGHGYTKKNVIVLVYRKGVLATELSRLGLSL